MKYLYLICMMLASCNLRPTQIVTHPNGTRTINTLGMSAMTKADTEFASMTMPDGSRMEYGTTGKNETTVPVAAITTHGLIEMGAQTAGVENLKTSTNGKVQINGQNSGVKTTEILSKERTTLGTFVPPKP